jgi:hypothetical protein
VPGVAHLGEDGLATTKSVAQAIYLHASHSPKGDDGLVTP